MVPVSLAQSKDNAKDAAEVEENVAADAEFIHHIPPQPMHNMLAQHHVESQPARTVFGHFMDNTVQDQAQVLLTSGGE